MAKAGGLKNELNICDNTETNHRYAEDIQQDGF